MFERTATGVSLLFISIPAGFQDPVLTRQAVIAVLHLSVGQSQHAKMAALTAMMIPFLWSSR